MQNGIYRARFQVGPNVGAGVVTIRDGNLSGGDSGFYYFGTFNEDGSSITGTVDIRQHDASAENVFAGLSSFLLTFNGQAASSTAATLHGTTAAAPGHTVSVDLHLLQQL